MGAPAGGFSTAFFDDGAAPPPAAPSSCAARSADAPRAALRRRSRGCGQALSLRAGGCQIASASAGVCAGRAFTLGPFILRATAPSASTLKRGRLHSPMVEFSLPASRAGKRKRQQPQKTGLHE